MSTYSGGTSRTESTLRQNKWGNISNPSEFGDVPNQRRSPNTRKWDPEDQSDDDEQTDDHIEPKLLVKFVKLSRKRMQMEIQSEVLETVLKSAEGLPICIINIVGAENLGKSLVLNTILQELEFIKRTKRKNAMGIANKILLRFNCRNNGKGQGMFVWPQTINLNTDGQKIAVLLMETNGLHDDAYDSAEGLTSIFCLSFLLSSTLIYNCTENGITDDTFMPWLPYIRYGRKLMQEFEDSNERPFQTLSFLVRDWQNTSDDYNVAAERRDFLLEKAGQMGDPNSKKYVLAALKEYFSNLDCTFLPPPGSAVRNVDFSGALNQLEEDFIRQLGKFRDLITSRLQSKKVLRTNMKPPVLKRLLPAYVELINSYNNRQDKISAETLHTVTSVTLVECNIDEAESMYKSIMENKLKKAIYILETHLHALHKDALKQVSEYLTDSLPDLEPWQIKECRKQLSTTLTDLFETYQQQNQQHREEEIAEKLQPLISQYKKTLKRRIVFDSEFSFYEDNIIEDASNESFKFIQSKLLANFPTESDDGLQDITEQLKKRTNQILSNITAKNSAIRQGAMDRVMGSIEELKNRYHEDLQEHMGETESDSKTLLATHKLLKKQALRDFKNMHLPGSNEVKQSFLTELENQIESIFAGLYDAQEETLQVHSEKTSQLANSLAKEYETIIKVSAHHNMTQDELEDLHQNISDSLIQKLHRESPISLKNVNGKILQQGIEREFRAVYQHIVQNYIERQKVHTEKYAHSRNLAMAVYREGMEEHLRCGSLSHKELANAHAKFVKKSLHRFYDAAAGLPLANESKDILEASFNEAFKEYKKRNRRSFQEDAEAQKVLTEIQQQFVSEMDNYKSKDDVTYAQQKYMEKCSSVLDRKIRSGNMEVKNELLGKCKKFFTNTCNVIAESLELNSERDRLKLSKLLGDLRNNYHEEMTISVKSNSYPNVGAINKLHKKVVDKIIDSLTRRDSIQLSPEQRQNLFNCMEDSVTKYRIDFSLNSSNQMEDPAIGIDLGTTYCCVTVIWRDQRMKIISSSEGSDTTPSYVAFHEDGSHVVGQTAKDAAYRNPESTIFDAKRMIGRRITDANLRRDIMFWPFEIKDCNGIPKIDIRGQMIPPEQISAILLANLKSQAEEQLGLQISKAVITVPAYFSDGQRAATKDAAEMAGLEVLTILNEPTAAAIAYKMEHFSEKPKKVLVFDLGGGTFDVAVLQTAATSIEVLSVDGDTHLGGEDFDKNLMDECVRIFRRKAGIDLFEYKDSDSKPKREDARRMIRRLQTYCEKAKRQLSSAMHATISVDGLAQGHDFHEVFSRSKFEDLNKTLFRQTIEVVDKALEGAKLKKKDIDDILLVGGSTRIPKIKEMLSKHFNNKTLSHSVHPDIAVAYGAAIQAALLNGGDTDDLLKFETIRDVTPMSLGISASLGKKVEQLMVVIPKNTKIPHRATESFRTSFKNQDFMRISVYQGDDAIAANNNLLGTFELSDIPPSKSGKESVDVTMEIDKMGILQVTAMCRSTQETQSLIVQSNKDRLSEAEKQKISNSIRKSKVTQKYDGDSPDNKSSDDESTGCISSDDEPIKKPQSFKNQSSVLSESSSDSEPDDLEEW